MENKELYKVEDFLRDNSFINHVFGLPDEEKKEDWDSLLSQNNNLSNIAEQAREVLLAPADVECELSSSESEALKEKIFTSLGKL